MVIGHAVLHRHLAGQTGLHFWIVLGPIVGRAGAAEAAKTTGSPHHLLACVPQRFNDSDAFRHVILLAGDLDGDHPWRQHLGLINDVGVFLCHFSRTVGS